MRITLYIASLLLLFSSCGGDKNEIEGNTNTPPDAPQLISPINNSDIPEVNSNDPIYFRWSVPYDPDEDVVSYKWYYTRVSSTGDTFSGHNGTSKTEFKANAQSQVGASHYFEAGDTIYWKVTAEDSKGNISEYSDTWELVIKTLSNQAPTIPNLITPNSNVNLASNAVSFEWSTSTDPQGDSINYEFSVSKNNDFNESENENLSDISITLNLEYATTYYWRVRAYDSSGNYSDYSETRSFNVAENNNSPSIPTLIFPVNGTDCSNKDLSFQWNSSTDPNGEGIEYQLEISETQDFASLSFQYQTNSTSYNVNLEESKVYYWRVRASNTAGYQSEFSEVRNLYTQGVGTSNTAPLIEYTSPENNAVFSQNTVTVTWNGQDSQTASENLKYRVYFSESTNDFELLASDYAGSSYTFNDLSSGKTYKWLIYVTDEDGATSVGPVRYFSIN